MTAEVAIMNRSCVALAADSAFTDSRNKVRVGNKLFSMSPNNDIAIMIYGSSAFLEYPWEVLIKAFRSEVGRREFETVEDCANSFFEYISKDDICEANGECLSYMSIIYEELRNLKEIEDGFKKRSDFKKFLIT